MAESERSLRSLDHSGCRWDNRRRSRRPPQPHPSRSFRPFACRRPSHPSPHPGKRCWRCRRSPKTARSNPACKTPKETAPIALWPSVHPRVSCTETHRTRGMASRHPAPSAESPSSPSLRADATGPPRGREPRQRMPTATVDVRLPRTSRRMAARPINGKRAPTPERGQYFLKKNAGFPLVVHEVLVPTLVKNDPESGGTATVLPLT